VVYTRWRNLNKTSDMDVGAIGYHDRTKVKRMRVAKDNTIVNALNRTKEERHPNLADLQEARAAEFRAEQRVLKRENMKKDKDDRREREENAKMRSFETLLDESKMVSNSAMSATADARYASNDTDVAASVTAIASAIASATAFALSRFM
jgi:predicted nucleotidyltransferase